MKPAAFDYKRARTLPEAAEFLAAGNGDAKILAGGQSLAPMLHLRLARPHILIDIKRAEGLRELMGDDKVMSIGAGWTHAEIEDGTFEDSTRGLMPYVARGIAYRAVRNRGTIGGSLSHADPAADWISTTAALGATLVSQGADGRKHRLSADTFLEGAFQTRLGANEVLIAIEAPRLSDKAGWGYYKICRKSGEFATAIGVAIFDPKSGLSRVLAGATDGPPVLLPETAKVLIDKGASVAGDSVEAEIASVLLGHDAAARQLHATAVRRALDMLAVNSDR
ncbi:FAD binding domain-containing protein [Bradyrhizobium canariense]|uniref:Carbon-monoxide dehydrogenase medium subunit n=1 Tax=Bradyrhizobium canariense TaxID=255045 RepID=A0A1H1SSS8_9BRAD|nr:FAD binding domain-containing protein [Bradyrhizobium canariense]SDS50985.1 carbon-monoxide dehydrogenase medium subunit [Bradyrhizobium canariense]